MDASIRCGLVTFVRLTNMYPWKGERVSFAIRAFSIVVPIVVRYRMWYLFSIFILRFILGGIVAIFLIFSFSLWGRIRMVPAPPGTLGNCQINLCLLRFEFKRKGEEGGRLNVMGRNFFFYFFQIYR